jgi:alpha-1,2-glucosyltransferase
MEYVVLSVFSCICSIYLAPTVYMDEEFHVKQLSVYLTGDFWTWDPKITTLPGLYCLTYVVLKVTGLYYYFDLLILSRFVNTFLMLPLYYILNVLNPSCASLIMGYPPLFMVSFLYYTDTISLVFTVLALVLRKNHKILAFFVSGFSVFCRQTNIVWIGYFVGLEILKDYQIEEIRDCLKALKDWKNVIKKYFLDVLLALGFCLFLCWNQGIVVGDRESHSVKLHLAQLCYLFGLSLFYIPFPEISLGSTLKSFNFIMALPILSFFTYNFSYAHPYLLSDNTHYTFYIWKNLLKPYGSLLIPLYALGFSLLKQRKGLDFIWWLFCSSLVLIPAHLLEPRYFITPITFYLLKFKCEPSAIRRILVFILNLATITIFLLKPYKDIRFMW